MSRWPRDNQAARNAFYGDPGKGEIGPRMVPVVPPFAMYYDGKRIKAIQFHAKAAPALLAALNEIWDYCGHDQAKIDAAGASNYNGAYNHRLVRGSATKWSNHAYAAAIDLNAGQNGLGVKKGTMPQFVVDAFCRQGAMWGGWYKDRPDWMHFEFVDNGGRSPSQPAPGFGAPVGLLDVPDAPADELEDDTNEPVAPPPTDGPPSSGLIKALRTGAGTAVGTAVVGQVAEVANGPASDVVDQITQVVDKTQNVVAVTSKVMSVPKPGFANSLIHFITTPGFLMTVIVLGAAAWGLVWFIQRQQRKIGV